MIKKIILNISLLIIFLLLISINNGETVILFGGIVFLLYPYFLKKYLIKPNIPILLIIGFHAIILTIGVLLKGINNTNFVGNFYIIYLISSYYCGVLIFYKKNLTVFWRGLFFSVLVLFSFMLSKTLPIIIENKLYFGTYTGKHNQNRINLSEIKIDNLKQKNLTLSKLNSEIIIIDFWNNGCGVCIEKFQVLKRLILEKKIDTSKVKIISLNIYENKKEIKKGNQIFISQNLNFENYFANKKDVNVFNIKGYPTVVVIKKNEIIFKGSIETLNLFKLLYLN